MFIYIVCPVRNVTEEQTKEIDDYVATLEKEGHNVHYPPRDVNQEDETGINIVQKHKDAMKESDRVDIFWDKTSSGSHFDLGMAFMSGRDIKLVKIYQEDNPGKSYVKVMRILEEYDHDRIRILKQIKENAHGRKEDSNISRHNN